MLKEAIQEITLLAQRATKAGEKISLLKVEGEPRTLLIVDANGAIQERTLPEPDRKHELHSVDQIPALLKQAAAWEMKPLVFFNADGVSLVLDGAKTDSRRHAARIEFAHTTEFAWLLAAQENEGRNVDQKGFRRILRTIFVDAMETVQRKALLDSLAKLKFVNTETRTGRAEHGRESLGAEIDGECFAEISSIPEEIILRVRPFDDRALAKRSPVRVAIDIDTRQQLFTLTPVDADMDLAVERSLDDLHKLLTDSIKEVPIYFGTP